MMQVNKLRHVGLVLAFLLVATVLSATFVTVPFSINDELRTSDEYYVGVAFCGNTTEEAKMLIDRVKTYSNLFIVQSGPVSWNETATNEICDYAVAEGLKIIVYFGDLNPVILEAKGTKWRTNWVRTAKQRWGEKFLGLYYYDEWGGIWMDTNWTKYSRWSQANATYASVESSFVKSISRELSFVPSRDSFQLFISDYALYWYDYLGGYDVVLAQVGWNHSYAQDLALVRGAANRQEKDWGVILTWKYSTPPYLDSGEAIYSQMVTAFTSGAKYITIFNYPWLEGNAYGAMQDEHFAALERFWKDATTGKIKFASVKAEAALVLPQSYGWGMRNPDDKIWGFWGPDEKSPQIWAISRELLSKYAEKLDIVYEDPKFSAEGKYSHVYLWNATAPS